MGHTLSTPTRVFAALIPALVVGGCATAMYDGPKRSSDEVAIIKVVHGTKAHTIDGQRAASGSTFAVLPGVHSVALVLTGIHLTAEGEWYKGSASSPFTVCFRARAGHTYVARLEPGGASRPEIFDNTDDTEVPARSIDSPFSSCSISTAVANHPSVSPTSEPVDSAPSRPEAGYENPLSSRLSAVPSRRQNNARTPGTGARFEVGCAFGGDSLTIDANNNGHPAKLSAGEGLVLSLGGQWTPLWIGSAAGFGASASLGFKYLDVGDSFLKVGLGRFPAVLAAHSLLRISGNTFLLVKVGMEKDLWVRYLGNITMGVQTDFTSTLGFISELGLYWPRGQDLGFELALRYTAVGYGIAGVAVDASSIALLWTFHVPL